MITDMPTFGVTVSDAEQWGCWTQYFAQYNGTNIGAADTIATNEDAILVCYGGSSPDVVTHEVENDYFKITCSNVFPHATSVTLTAKRNCTVLQENYDITTKAIAEAYTPTSTSTLTLTAGNTYTVNALTSPVFAIKWIVQ